MTKRKVITTAIYEFFVTQLKFGISSYFQGQMNDSWLIVSTFMQKVENENENATGLPPTSHKKSV